MPDLLITKIERQKKARDRVSVFLNGEFALGLYDEVVLQFELRTGKNISAEQWEEIRLHEDFLGIKNAALRILTRRKQSAYELRRKLLVKKFASDSVQKVIDHLVAKGILSDREYAVAFVNDRMLFKPAGKKSLVNELRKHGVDQRLAAEVVASIVGDEDEQNDARSIAEKYMRRVAHLDRDKQRRRLTAFLVRRGYSLNIISPLVKELVQATTPTDDDVDL